MLKIKCDKGILSMEFEGTGREMIAETTIVINRLKKKIADDSGLPLEVVETLLESCGELIEK